MLKIQLKPLEPISHILSKTIMFTLNSIAPSEDLTVNQGFNRENKKNKTP